MRTLDVHALFTERDFDVEHESFDDLRRRQDRRARRPKKDKRAKKNKLRD